MKHPTIEIPIIALGAEVVTETTQRVLKSGTVQCDVEELAALKRAASGRVQAAALAPYDPTRCHSDGELDRQIRSVIEITNRLSGRREVLETRLISAREQTGILPEPRRSLNGLRAAASGVFTLCFAPPIYTVFFADLDDPVLAWALALITGLCAGAFLTLLISNHEEEE